MKGKMVGQPMDYDENVTITYFQCSYDGFIVFNALISCQDDNTFEDNATYNEKLYHDIVVNDVYFLATDSP